MRMIVDMDGPEHDDDDSAEAISFKKYMGQDQRNLERDAVALEIVGGPELGGYIHD